MLFASGDNFVVRWQFRVPHTFRTAEYVRVRWMMRSGGDDDEDDDDEDDDIYLRLAGSTRG